MELTQLIAEIRPHVITEIGSRHENTGNNWKAHTAQATSCGKGKRKQVTRPFFSCEISLMRTMVRTPHFQGRKRNVAEDDFRKYYKVLVTAAWASAASLGVALCAEQKTAMSHIPLPWLGCWYKSFPAKILSSSSHLQGTNIQSLTVLERGQNRQSTMENPCTCTDGFFNA